MNTFVASAKSNYLHRKQEPTFMYSQTEYRGFEQGDKIWLIEILCVGPAVSPMN